MRNLVRVVTLLAIAAAVGWLVYGRVQTPQRHTVPLAPLAGDGVPMSSAQPDTVAPQPPVSETSQDLAPAPTGSPASVSEFPTPSVVDAVPLPTLADSDADAIAALTELIGGEDFTTWMSLDTVIRNFVISVDNLPGGKLAVKHRLLKPWPGEFRVREKKEAVVLDPANYARYSPLVSLVTGVDPVRAAQTYRRFYPLLQDAYAGLGYPDKQFNERFIALLDHLIGVQPLNDPIRLIRPKVFYQFEDEKLENASPGAKILYRLGPEHAAAVQAWLRRLRAMLTQEDSVTTGR